MAHERQKLMRSLFDEYITMYASRDDRLTTRFSQNFSGYAGSSDILVTDTTEWIKITRRDFAQIPKPLRIEMLDLSLQDLSEDILVITAFFHIHLPDPEEILSRETARLVLIFRLEGEAWMIAHSGISIPYGLADGGEIYPMTRLEERKRELEQMIEERTLELAEANRQLEILSNTDGLTNIGNRRYFDRVLQEEWNRGHRAATPLALIMLDIDYFKRFNDHYGHLAGDACLQRLAHALRLSGRRAGELIARYGGEEFVVLQPNADIRAAVDTARHIRQVLADLAIPHDQTSPGIVTVSLGVASMIPSSDYSPVELVRQADAALYQAKQSGRNCIRSYG